MCKRERAINADTEGAFAQEASGAMARRDIPVLGLVHVASDRNATVAVVHGTLPNGTGYEVTGSAKREKGDPYDPRVGNSLALARALREAAEELEEYGYGLVLRETAKQEARAVRKVARQAAKDTPRKLLDIEDIREKYGPESAERAAQRRLTRLGKLGIAERWYVEGKDGFDPEADFYPLSDHASYEQAIVAARRHAVVVRKRQPAAGSIADRTYIVHPDGRRERVE